MLYPCGPLANGTWETGGLEALGKQPRPAFAVLVMSFAESLGSLSGLM